MVMGVREVAGEEPNNNPRLISVTVLLPKLATMAAPVASLMATPIGFVPVLTSGTGSLTDLRTRKSVTLEWTLPTVTSRAKRCGIERKDAGMVTVSCLSLTTWQLLEGQDAIDVPSKFTCAPEAKPVPKIWTPARSA